MMEERISRMLDDLDAREVDLLLDKDIQLFLDDEALGRIKQNVYEKTGLAGKKRSSGQKKLIAAAAALVIVLGSSYTVGFDNIANALSQVFSLIPGIGIVENDVELKGTAKIEYVLSEQVEAANDEAAITLYNGTATAESISVMIKLERKNISEEEIMKDKEAEWERLHKEDVARKPNASLLAKGVKYPVDSSSSSGGGFDEVGIFTFKLPKEEISTDQMYTFSYEKYGLSLDFQLKNFDSYSSLEEIGPTEVHNDISITVVPTFLSDSQVEVNLYSINKSPYGIYAFHKSSDGYLGEDLHLLADGQRREYDPLSGYGMAHGKFTFKISPENRHFSLELPYIVVQSGEAQAIQLKIPKEGEKVSCDYEIAFADSKVKIVELEKIMPEYQENPQLKMTLNYENLNENMVLMNTSLFRLNRFGRIDGGGYSSEVDENEITQVVYFDLEEGENRILRLQFANPVYYLTDDYSLAFER